MLKTELLTQGNTLKQGIISIIGYNKGVLGCWCLPSKFSSFGGEFFAEKELEGIELDEETVILVEGIKQESPFDYSYEKDIVISLEDGDWENISWDVYFKGKYLTCIKYLHEFENLIKFIKYN